MMMMMMRLVAFALGATSAWSLRPASRSPRAAVSMSAELKFSKYQGLGNDFLLVDNRSSKTPLATPQQAAALCDRNFGIGADGLIFVMAGEDGADFKMTIYNSDSSEPEMCGNGIRCLARYLGELGEEGAAGADGAQVFTISTGAGPIVPVVRGDGLITVDMGEPVLDGPLVPCALAPTKDGGRVVDAALEAAGQHLKVTAVSMGNPHSVAFVDDAKAVDLATTGRAVEVSPAFPEKVNAEFVDVVDRSHVNMVVWERGCGVTLACGTGACAVGVAGVLTGRTDRTCEVMLPGGPLEIEWRESDNRVYMTGPADFVFKGTAPLPDV